MCPVERGSFVEVATGAPESLAWKAARRGPVARSAEETAPPPVSISTRPLPDPIPNSEVKLVGADGTARVILWESRTLPGLSCWTESPSLPPGAGGFSLLSLCLRASADDARSRQDAEAPRRAPGRKPPRREGAKTRARWETAKTRWRKDMRQGLRSPVVRCFGPADRFWEWLSLGSNPVAHLSRRWCTTAKRRARRLRLPEDERALGETSAPWRLGGFFPWRMSRRHCVLAVSSPGACLGAFASWRFLPDTGCREDAVGARCAKTETAKTPRRITASLRLVDFFSSGVFASWLVVGAPPWRISRPARAALRASASPPWPRSEPTARGGRLSPRPGARSRSTG